MLGKNRSENGPTHWVLWENSTSVRISLKKIHRYWGRCHDADYRGEVGVILFNFGSEDFIVNMGDRIAQLIIEKIKTPEIKESEVLDGTDRGASGYGSTGTGAVLLDDSNKEGMKPKDVNDATKKNSLLSQSRRIISARQISKLAKGDNPVFLAIVRATNEDSKTNGPKKRSSARAARFAAAHGLSEGKKRSINKSQGPKKDIIMMAE